MTKTINNYCEGLIVKENQLVYIRNYNKYKIILLKDVDSFNKTQDLDCFKLSDNFYNYNHVVLSKETVDVNNFLFEGVFKLYIKFRKQIKDFNKIK